MYRILVIEDDPDIQEVLDNYLSAEGYQVILADDGMDGMDKFHSAVYDLVLLDVMMPKIDGYGVCEFIRRESDVPLVMLTALDSEAAQIKGLDLQADDYITKPFSVPVLMRKIAALLRRTAKEDAQPPLVYRDLRLDDAGYHAYFKGEEMELTQKEFEMLKVFLNNRGLVLTRQMLLDLVWGRDYFGDERIVDTHIKNIRKKIGMDYIRTIRGVGYRIDKEI